MPRSRLPHGGGDALGNTGSMCRPNPTEVENVNPDKILRHTAALGREITTYANVIEATLQQARASGDAPRPEDEAAVRQLAPSGSLGTQLEAMRDAPAKLSAAPYEQGISLKEETQGGSMKDDGQGVGMNEYYQRVRMTGDDVPAYRASPQAHPALCTSPIC